MFSKLYKWHHRIGLLVALPILGWCISGLTHPMMAHLFRIEPAQKFIQPTAIQLDSTTIPLTQALQKHGIDSIVNFRLIQYQGATYYQIVQASQPTVYIHTQHNTMLDNGDQLYASYLARYFLGDSSSTIQAIQLLDEFTFEYKFINRLLPVYKVSFERADKMDVYVSTHSSRLGTLNNNTRRACITTFSYLHNWSFLNAYPTAKLWLMLVFMGLSFFVAASGLVIYGFMWKSLSNNRASSPKASKARNWHRKIGLLVSISTLCFAFSGGYHALAKKNYQAAPTTAPYQYGVENLEQWSNLVAHLDGRLVKDISLAQFNGRAYFRVVWMDKRIEIGYFDCETLELLSKGEERYAIALAEQYTSLPKEKVLLTEPIYKFGGEYGFINKRLPVVKVKYNTPTVDHVYIETSSGKLATHVSTPKRREALSFLMLHKYHFLDPLGKKLRDTVIVGLILGILFVHILGIILWWRSYRKT